MSRSVRQVETSVHGPNFHLCGIKPKPSEERVALNRDYHPGFGYVRLLKDGEEVWGTVHPEESRTLGWVERTKVDDEKARWQFDIDGPMTSYTLVRRWPKALGARIVTGGIRMSEQSQTRRSASDG